MAETIINSNQLRASGDTSSQTLIGANQVRQSGDSSSQTLLNKNQIAGGGGTTLNATVVGNPTISDDFVVSAFTQNNYLTIPVDTILMGDVSRFEFRTKVYCHQTFCYIVHNEGGFAFKSYDTNALEIWYSIGSTSSGGANRYYPQASYYRNWCYFKIVAERSSNEITTTLFASLDGVNWTSSSGNTSCSSSDKFLNGNYVLTIGNNIFSRNEYFRGSIDMKETILKVDNQIVWKGVI